jgi:oligopeptide transport system permease protein
MITVKTLEFTPEESRRTLELINVASEEALLFMGCTQEAAEGVIKGRPWNDLEAIEKLASLSAEGLAGIKKIAGGGTEKFSMDEPLVEGTSLWKDAWKRLLKNKMAVVCGAAFLFVLAFCLLGWVLTFFGFDPAKTNIDYGAHGPSLSPFYPFGTDALGRDLMIRVMQGGQISLAVGVIATSVSLVIGVTYGATAAFLGGRTESLMMRFVDVMFALPYIFVVIIVMTLIPEEKLDGTTSLYILFIVLGAVQWLVMARIVRGQVLSLKKREFVEAARAIGVSNTKIIFRHLIPNTLGPIIVYTTLTIPAVMLEEAFLSFIGLGVRPPTASWGTLLAEGANEMAVHPWLLIFPALMMSITLFSLNFLGDGLRDALDPQLRKD